MKRHISFKKKRKKEMLVAKMKLRPMPLGIMEIYPTATVRMGVEAHTCQASTRTQAGRAALICIG